jgi:virginiamycin B lyase
MISRFLIAAVVALCLGCGGNGSDRQGAPPQTVATATEPAEPQDVEEAGATAVSITGDWLSQGADAIWLTNPPSNEIYRLNPVSGETVATIPVPESPCAASDFGFGMLWTATCVTRGLARIDPAVNLVTAHLRLPVAAADEGGESSVAAGEGAVWVVLQGGAVGRVDPRSLEVVSRIPVQQGAAAVRAGEGAVWVTNPARSLVQKIDPASNRVVATTPVGPGPRFLAVGESGVWTLNQEDGSVTRLDPATGEVAATIPADVVGQGGDITAGAGSVWVRGSGYLLTRIDPDANEVAGRYGPSSGSGAVIVAPGAVWLSAHDVGTVWRLPLGG